MPADQPARHPALQRLDAFVGEWTLLRAAPDFTPLDFRQRFVGELSADGRTITGRWESSTDGSTWELDFDLTYRKLT